MATRILTDNLSVPLGGAKTAIVDIHADTGNLTIDRLTGGEHLLAAGTLQYSEKRGSPSRALDVSGGQATLLLKGGGGGRSWLRLPWAACAGALEWHIHLNPGVPSDITAHSGGGNVKLDLAGMAVAGLSAETGGGNVEVALPDNASDLRVVARTGGGNVTVEIGDGITGRNTVRAESGAGNVVVRVPGDVAARIRATSGLGKVIVGSRFGKMDDHTYQSPDYDEAADRIDIAVQSGAGNVSVDCG